MQKSICVLASIKLSGKLNNKQTSLSLFPAFPHSLLFLSPACIHPAGNSLKGNRSVAIVKSGYNNQNNMAIVTIGLTQTGHFNGSNWKNPSYLKYFIWREFFCLFYLGFFLFVWVFVFLFFNVGWLICICICNCVFFRSPGLCSCVFYNWQRVLQSNPYLERESHDWSWRYSHSSCAE